MQDGDRRLGLLGDVQKAEGVGAVRVDDGVQVDPADALERADHEGVGGEQLAWTLALDVALAKAGVELLEEGRPARPDSSIGSCAVFVARDLSGWICPPSAEGRMRRTEMLQGLRWMKFEEIYGRWQQRRLSQAEAAEILGMSERSFRRWQDRYQADGLEGLADRRLGKASARRVPVDRVDEVLSLYRERYGGFTAKHFHDKLRQHHGFELGYTWTKLRLQASGLVPKGPRRSAHRKKRPRRPVGSR